MDGEGLCVLIVDDEADQREMYAEGLRHAGHRVLALGSGTDALTLAAQIPLDVVVIDGFLAAGETGWALAKRFRAHATLKSLPLVLLTAAALPRADEAEIAASCDVLLEKPCLPETLSERLIELVGRGLPTPAAEGASIALYISSKSVSSAGIEERLRRRLQHARATHIRFEVHDLSIDPAAGDRDGVTYTPTLVIRTASGERRVVVGDLQDGRAQQMALALLGDVPTTGR